MSEKLYLTIDECDKAAKAMAVRLTKDHRPNKLEQGRIWRPAIYGVPRGGVPVAFLLANAMPVIFVDKPEEAELFVDDLIDSGATRDKYAKDFPGIPFVTLFDKVNSTIADKWLVFPWEGRSQSNDDSITGTIINRLRAAKVPFLANDCIADHISKDELELVRNEVKAHTEAMLRALIIDVDADHNMRETADRFADMLVFETMRGRFFPGPDITEFPNAKKLDELYTVGPISVRSMCSHHLQPIIGQAWVGVIPDKKLIGLSKFVRVLRWICARPQIQEEMTIQLADELERLTQPKGLAVVIKATHGCMTCRGVREADECEMINSVMRGAFRTKPEARAEFLALIQ